MDGVYYLVSEQSPVMQVIRKHEELHKQFQSAIEEFRKKHGGDGMYTYGSQSFAGLRFDRETPPGWRRKQGGMCVPDTRCKAGKEIKREVAELPRGFDPWTFSSDLGEEYLHFDSGKVYFSTLGHYVGKYVLRVPAACRVTPEGCTELKMSEYWKIREDAGHGSRVLEDQCQTNS